MPPEPDIVDTDGMRHVETYVTRLVVAKKRFVSFEGLTWMAPP
jgi:hypothetical protein